MRLWVKNKGTEYQMVAGGAESFDGAMNSLIRINESTDYWELLEYEIQVPEEQWLRVELNILNPGGFKLTISGFKNCNEIPAC